MWRRFVDWRFDIEEKTTDRFRTTFAWEWNRLSPSVYMYVHWALFFGRRLEAGNSVSGFGLEPIDEKLVRVLGFCGVGLEGCRVLGFCICGFRTWRLGFCLCWSRRSAEWCDSRSLHFCSGWLGSRLLPRPALVVIDKWDNLQPDD